MQVPLPPLIPLKCVLFLGPASLRFYQEAVARAGTCGMSALCLSHALSVPEEILFYRLIAHITYDLTSPCWNQLHYLPQIIVSAGCSF